ncbi:MAG: TetR family transcriptional regulator [Myxococcota bacterium]
MSMDSPPVGARASQADRRSRRTRLRILDAAASQFARHGFRRARIEAIATAAGVSRALVYAHFDSKEALLLAVRDREIEGWRAAVEPAIERAGQAREALETMLRETLLYALGRPFLRAMLGEDERVVLLGGDALSRRAIAGWRARLVEALERGVAEGELRPDLDVESTADVLQAMQLGVIDRMHRQVGAIDVASTRHVTAAVRLLLDGVERPS